MKTYAEIRGRKPFNWNAALASLGRDKYGIPLDGKLEKLGIDFYEHVFNGNWPRVCETLAKIEVRSAQLLAEMEVTK